MIDQKQPQAMPEILSAKFNFDTIKLSDPDDASRFRKAITLSFHSLLALSLTQCKLVSIDFMSFLNAPNLQFFNVAQNHITSLKPFVKLSSGNIRKLMIQTNNLVNPQNFNQTLTRCLLSKKTKSLALFKIQALSIPMEEKFCNIQCQDLSSLSKLNVSFIMSLKILNGNRIPQNQVTQCRRRKNRKHLEQF